MKRRLLKLGLLLLLGAIVNVAVALSIGRWGETPKISMSSIGDEVALHRSDIRLWRRYAPHQYEAPQSGTRYKFFGKQYRFMTRLTNTVDPTHLSDEELQKHLQQVNGFGLWTLECGLPLRCTGAESWFEVLGFQRTATQYSNPTLGPIRLPSRIIWPGFAINTIFYAAILWVVFFVPGMVNRGVRRRRGLCPACAYPTWGGGTSPVCTECGSAVEARTYETI